MVELEAGLAERAHDAFPSALRRPVATHEAAGPQSLLELAGRRSPKMETPQFPLDPIHRPVPGHGPGIKWPHLEFSDFLSVGFEDLHEVPSGISLLPGLLLLSGLA